MSPKRKADSGAESKPRVVSDDVIPGAVVGSSSKSDLRENSTATWSSPKRRRTDDGFRTKSKSADAKPNRRSDPVIIPPQYDLLDKHQVFNAVKSKQEADKTTKSDTHIKEQAEGSRSCTTRDRGGRVLQSQRIEVVVPSLQEVRRRQARRLLVACQASGSSTRPYLKGDPDGADPSGRVSAVKVEPTDGGQEVLYIPRSLDDPQTLRTALERLRNPDVKVKKELLLSDEFLLDALTWEGINHRYPIPVPKEIAECGFSRPYISHLYGGSLRATFPSPSPDILEWHGLDDWAFLNLDYCPHAPTRPGYSGLHFSSHRARSTWEKLATPLRTFVKLASSRWVYMGQYQFAPGKSLTTTAWLEQKPEVRKTWATGLLNKQWGRNVLLRIWFRKTRGADYEPTKDDFADATVDIKNIRTAMTEKDIIDAYTCGEEEIGTYTMTCVGYDEPFVRVLEANACRFVASTQQKAASGDTKGSKKTKRAGRTNRAEDLEKNRVSEDDHESAAGVLTSGQRRSTRTR